MIGRAWRLWREATVADRALISERLFLSFALALAVWAILMSIFVWEAP